MVGKRIGNYVVSALLGEGGFGAVYLAEHPQIKRQVAIKILDQRMAGRQSDRFIDEAMAATIIKHPNIIDIFDLGRTDEGWFYYVMEKLEGRDLLVLMDEQIKAHGRMTAATLLPLVQQICAGLQAAHDRGIVHRDLKPENIFVTDDDPPVVKIVDFGIAKLMEREEEGTSRTHTGIVMGTPLFIAPEQAAGEVREISYQTDLYSLGVILYLALLGEPPFQNKSHRLLMFSHMYDQPEPLPESLEGCPDEIRQLVAQCLEKTPGDRPGSAAEVAERFTAALGRKVESSPTTAGHSSPGGPLSNIPVKKARGGPAVVASGGTVARGAAPARVGTVAAEAREPAKEQERGTLATGEIRAAGDDQASEESVGTAETMMASDSRPIVSDALATATGPTVAAVSDDEVDEEVDKDAAPPSPVPTFQSSVGEMRSRTLAPGRAPTTGKIALVAGVLIALGAGAVWMLGKERGTPAVKPAPPAAATPVPHPDPRGAAATSPAPPVEVQPDAAPRAEVSSPDAGVAAPAAEPRPRTKKRRAGRPGKKRKGAKKPAPPRAEPKKAPAPKPAPPTVEPKPAKKIDPDWVID